MRITMDIQNLILNISRQIRSNFLKNEISILLSKSTALFLFICILGLSTVATAQTVDADNNEISITSVFAGGDGTSSNPYVIVNWAQLHAIRNHLNAHFILGADLSNQTSDYNTFASSTANSGSGWSSPNATNIFNILIPFTGTFNGNGYSISDLFINRPSTSSTGIFSVLGNGA